MQKLECLEPEVRGDMDEYARSELSIGVLAFHYVWFA